jgi:hypothetical protein
VIYEREEQILACLEQEMTLDDLEDKNIMYRQDQKQYKTFVWFEKQMIQKHLDRLIDMGKVRKRKRGFEVL